jgi:hypothetical protein
MCNLSPVKKNIKKIWVIWPYFLLKHGINGHPAGLGGNSRKNHVFLGP